MADIVTPARRSEIMSRIRGGGTKPELIVRSAAARLPVPAPRQEAPGVSGPGLSPQEAGPVRSWLFLAQASGLPLLLCA